MVALQGKMEYATELVLLSLWVICSDDCLYAIYVYPFQCVKFNGMSNGNWGFVYFSEPQDDVSYMWDVSKFGVLNSFIKLR